MGTVNVFTAARSQAIEDNAIVSGVVDEDGHLQLQTHAGETLDAGVVKGPQGDVGPAADIPAATQTVAGIAEIATSADVILQTDNTKMVSPAGLANLQIMPKGRMPTVTVTSGSFSIDSDGTIHFTAASGIKIDNVFDGQGMDVYDIYHDMDSSDTSVKAFRFLSNGVEQMDNSSYGGSSSTVTFGSPPTAAVTALSGSGNSYFGFMSVTATGSGHTGSGHTRVYRPGVNKWTRFQFESYINYSVASSTSVASGSLNYTKVYTGFSVVGATNFTGTIKIVKVA